MKILNESHIILQTEDGYVLKGCYSDFEKAFTSASDALQYAVDEMKGSVMFGDGDYVFTDNVIIKRTITITGNGKNTRILSKCDKAMHFYKSHGSLVDRLHFINDGKSLMGMHIQTSGDLKVTNCSFTDFDKYGVLMSDCAFLCSISDCTFAGNKEIHIRCMYLREGEYGDYIPNLISDIHIYGGGAGIQLESAIVFNIVGCCVYQTNGNAFNIFDDSNSVLLSGCRTYQITGDAVYVKNAHELNVTGNIFCWHTGQGIKCEDCCWGTISGNNIIDSGSYNNGQPNRTITIHDIKDDLEYQHGISLTNIKSYVVSSNSLFNWGCAPQMDCGIVEDDKCSDNVIANNNVNFYENEAVVSKGTKTVAHHNYGYGERAHLAMGDYKQTYCIDWTNQFIEKIHKGEYDLKPSCGQVAPYDKRTAYLPPVEPTKGDDKIEQIY